MSDVFTHLLRVRYSECDAQQVVFNAKYAEYADIAATEFTRAIWGNYGEMLASGFDNQVVSLTIDWKAPAEFDDVLAIRVQVSHVGTTSYSLVMDFIMHETGQSIAQAKVTYVFVDTKSYSKTPVPQTMRGQLERGAVGVISNHAGVVI